jgi:cytochrome c556
MARAAAELADAKETDAKAIRQHLRGVYEKCQACHDGQR